MKEVKTMGRTFEPNKKLLFGQTDERPKPAIFFQTIGQASEPNNFLRQTNRRPKFSKRHSDSRMKIV